MKTIYLTEENRAQLKNILEMLRSTDPEIQLLAGDLFQTMFPLNAYFNTSVKIGKVLLHSINDLNVWYSELWGCIIGVTSLEVVISNTLDSNFYWVLESQNKNNFNYVEET